MGEICGILFAEGIFRLAVTRGGCPFGDFVRSGPLETERIRCDGWNMNVVIFEKNLIIISSEERFEDFF